MIHAATTTDLKSQSLAHGKLQTSFTIITVLVFLKATPASPRIVLD